MTSLAKRVLLLPVPRLPDRRGNRVKRCGASGGWHVAGAVHYCAAAMHSQIGRVPARGCASRGDAAMRSCRLLQGRVRRSCRVEGLARGVRRSSVRVSVFDRSRWGCQPEVQLESALKVLSRCRPHPGVASVPTGTSNEHELAHGLNPSADSRLVSGFVSVNRGR